MNELVESKRHSRKRILWGLMLVAAGVMFLLDHFDAFDLAMMWRFWPLLLVVSGLVDVLSASRWKHIGEGLNQIVIGFWLFASIEHLWGLTWVNSWPLLLIGFGLTVVLGALPDQTTKQ